MNKCRQLVLNDEPNYRIIWSISIVVVLIIFIVIALFYKYNKFTKFRGLVYKEGSDFFVQIFVPYDNMGVIKDDRLIINGIERDYTYEVTDSIYNQNNKIYILVNIIFDNNDDLGRIIDVVFKSKETTFVDEIKNKIRKG